jgi:uncharacterized membrane protein
MNARLRQLLELTLTLAAMGGIALLLWPVASEDALTFVLEGEDYELLAPRRLLALAVLPLLVWIALRSLADLPGPQRWLALALRAAIIAVLALALAHPVRTTDSTQVSTVFLVDVSESVTDAQLTRATEVVQQAWEARGENDVRLVVFARDARAVPLDDDQGQLPPLKKQRMEGDAGAGSDLQAALRLAYGLFPPDHLRRVVLLSDGGQTEGDLLAEAGRADRFGVRLFYHPYEGEGPRETAVRELHLPDRIKVGEPFHVRARVFASAETEARVRLYQGATLNGLDGVRDVELDAGTNELKFRSVVRVAGPVTYRLEVEPKGADRFEDNNRFSTTAVVPGPPRVLYVEGAKGRANYLARALTTADYAVDVRSPAGIPSSLGGLQPYDFFILSDVPASEVSLTQMDVIERYVRNLGGGFLMAGGEQGFGLGGWQGTRLERLLPVRMDAERRREQPSLALALVIDKSGSMDEGQKIELAKSAAKSTAEMLGPDDYIEVIGFDSQPQRIVRMQSAANRMRILRDIGRLSARGGTAIFPALDRAYQDLAVTRAKTKHVILLTDGQSPERGIHDLVQVMRTENITVSTVGLGANVDRPLLQEIAEQGAGRSYFTKDPHNIPRIFMKETNTVARSAAVEEYFRPVVVERADFLRGVNIGSAPFLHGYVATRAKPAPAQVILASDLGEPILARWRAGLGWALAWTSDVKNRWAVDWLRWSDFSRFWAQLIREHMRQQRRQTLDMRAEVVDGEVNAVVNAIDKNDEFMNGLDSTVTIKGPMGSGGSGDGEPLQEQHTLQQTAPGRYEAHFPLERYGSFVVTAEHRREGKLVAESSAQLANPYPREYRTLEPDRQLMRQAAETTGGAANPSPTELFDPQGESIEAYEPVWPRLLFVALALFLLDLLLRRVRLFDRQFRTAPARAPARGARAGPPTP